MTTGERSELRSGWGVLLAATVGMMLGMSAIPFYTLSIFAGPATAATGWSMREFQFHYTCVSLGVLFVPLHGYLLDRFDPRRVALASIAAVGVLVMVAGIAATWGLAAFYVTWFAVAVCGQSTGPVGWTKFVTGWFDRRRGIALGIALAGSGLFAVLAPPLLVRVIEAFGWQAGYLALGAAVLTISLPVSFAFLRSPPRLAPAGSADAPRATLGAALRNYRFWIIAVSFALLGFVVAGVISNLVPMLELRGVPRREAAAMAGLVGIAVVTARVVVGLLLDRFWPPAIAAVSLGLPALACLILSGTIALPPVIAVLLVGMAAGAEFDILAYLVSRYFPREAYGRVYALTFMAMIGGSAIAPPLFGSSYDHFGEYTQILTVAAVVFALAPLLLFALGRVPASAEAVPGR